MTFVWLAVVIILVSIGFAANRNDGNHVKCDGVKFFKITDVKMQNPNLQKAFDFFKSMLLDKKLVLNDVLRDVDLRREYNKIKDYDNVANKNDSLILDALQSEFLHFTHEIAPSNIILNPQEECYFHSHLCAVDTVQKIGKNISYGGIRFNENGVRSGNCTVYSKDIKKFQRFDYGMIVVTNQRIIFKGEKKNKTIPIGSIISVEAFEDNGVMISMSNRENPIIIRFRADKCFNHCQNQGNNFMFFHNDLNWFNKAIDKALYKRLIPKEVQDIRKEADELNFLVAKKTMVAEGLETE